MRDPLNDSYIVFLKKSGIASFLQEKPRDFYISDSKKVNSLTLKIENISNVDELEFFIKQSNICDLKNHAKHTVIGDGNTQAERTAMEMVSVDQFEYTSNFDVLENLTNGMYANKLLTHDIVRMKYDTLDFNYIDKCIISFFISLRT